jgi:hypothetical protein
LQLSSKDFGTKIFDLIIDFGTKIFDLIISSHQGMNVKGRNPNLSAGVIGEYGVGRDCTRQWRQAGWWWQKGLHGL